MVFTTEELFEVAIESWPQWDLNPRPLNSVQTRYTCYSKQKANIIQRFHYCLLQEVTMSLFICIKLCKRPEMNNQPTHLITFIKNGKALSSLGGMQARVSRPALASTMTQANQKVLQFLRLSKTRFSRRKC